jgi:hypothetical protein
MKKTLFLVIFFCLLSSCSSDSNSSNSDAFLIKKIVSIFNDTQQVALTSNYTYQGKKLKEVTFSRYLVKYFYDGDLIVKTETYFDKNILITQSNYTYDSAKRLVQTKTDYFASIEITNSRDTFDYNIDNTVDVKIFNTLFDSDFDPNTIETEQLNSTSKYYLGANNQILKTEDYLNNGTEIRTFTSDSKNNPFKNIVGMNKLLYENKSNFNVIAVDYSGLNEESHPDQIYNITYNANDFPITESIIGNGMTNHYSY